MNSTTFVQYPVKGNQEFPLRKQIGEMHLTMDRFYKSIDCAEMGTAGGRQSLAFAQLRMAEQLAAYQA